MNQNENTFYINEKTLSITDIDYRYSMKSGIHSLSVVLSQEGAKMPLTFSVAKTSQDLVKFCDQEDNRQINPLEILSMSLAKQIISSLCPELTENFDLSKKHLNGSATLIVNQTDLYYSLKKTQSDKIPSDINIILNSLSQCLLAVEGYQRGTPTEKLKTASVTHLSCNVA